MFSFLPFIPTIVAAYNSLCPHTGHWISRSKARCNKTEEYVCLWDDLNEKYKENCNGPLLDRPGNRHVLNRDNFDRRPCTEGFYQPYKFTTFGNNGCAFQKTNCEEEGLVLVDNGGPTEDTRCRCDYTRGYAFIENPGNACSCIPAKEDCSCYIKRCNNGKNLTQDYKCGGTTQETHNFICPQILKTYEKTYKKVKDSLKQYVYDKNYWCIILIAGVVTGVVIVTGLFIVVIYCSSNTYYEKEELILGNDYELKNNDSCTGMPEEICLHKTPCDNGIKSNVNDYISANDADKEPGTKFSNADAVKDEIGLKTGDDDSTTMNKRRVYDREELLFRLMPECKNKPSNLSHVSDIVVDNGSMNSQKPDSDGPKRMRRCAFCEISTVTYRCNECKIDICEQCNISHSKTQSHLVEPLSYKYVYDYTFQLKNCSCIYDLKITPDGSIVYGSYKKQLIICSLKGEQTNVIDIKKTPKRITVIDNHRVAVTFFGPNCKILILSNIKETTTPRWIGDEKQYWGISYITNKLFVGCNCGNENTIEVLSLEGEVLRTIEIKHMPYFICVDKKGLIYYAESKKNNLFVLTENNDSCERNYPGIKEIRGMTIYNNVNLLLLCSKSKRVYNVSPDGTQNKPIISKLPISDDVHPFICFDSVSKSILVACGTKVFVYKLKIK